MQKLRPPAVIVVDPVSTGANLAHEIMTRKIPCIRVYSRYVPPSLVGMIAQGVLQDYAVRTLLPGSSLFPLISTAPERAPRACMLIATLFP